MPLLKVTSRHEKTVPDCLLAFCLREHRRFSRLFLQRETKTYDSEHSAVSPSRLWPSQPPNCGKPVRHSLRRVSRLGSLSTRCRWHTSPRPSESRFQIRLESEHRPIVVKNLLNLPGFAILHVNDNHYVLADPNKRNDNAFRIYDHDIGARWYNQQSLEAVWKGTSLVLEKDPNFKFPSLISAPTYWIDKGDFTAKEDAEYFFTIKNASAETIELKVDATSCQCSSAMLATTVIEPGEETILVASVKLDSKRGGFRERVVILSTCGDEKRTDSFILAGTVIRHDILSATRL